jgi:hypothetical protein
MDLWFNKHKQNRNNWKPKMFKRLLSNLPFNPSLIDQVSFYTKRMHREESLRRLGLGFIVLAMVVQMFAIISPPEPTLASSGNDIINGGFSSREQAVNYCRNNTQQFGTILAYYQVTCETLGSAATVQLKSTDHSKELDSMGRIAQGAKIAKTGKATNEYSVSIDGRTYYMRNLWAWDSGSSSTYSALKMTNSKGQVIYILFNCGNIITVGKYTPPPPPPPPENSICVIKGLPNSIKPSQKFQLTFTVKNGGNIPGKETWPTTTFKLATSSPKMDGQAFTVSGNGGRVLLKPNSSVLGGVLTRGGTSVTTVTFTSPSASGTYPQTWELIDEGSTRYGRYATCATSISVNKVETPQKDMCPGLPGIQLTTAECDVCPNVPGTQTSTTQCDVCPSVPGVQYSTSQCDVCPSVPGTQTSTSQCDVCPNIAGTQLTTAECDVCPNVPGVQSNRNECYPCDEAQNDNSTTACLELNKTASNQTQNIEKADGTMAKANDVIVYTLSVKNKGKQTVRDFVIEENMTDVLEYANIVSLDGGKIDDQNVVRWPKEDISAGAVLQRKITVRIKNPIPQTPVSASDRGSFDLVMTNVFYGSSVNIKLPPSVTKITENVVQQLPNTGPGTTLFAGFALTTFVSYFFARTRLLGKELDIVRTEYITTGGA